MTLMLLEPGELTRAIGAMVTSHPLAVGAAALALLGGAIWFGLDHRR